FFNSGSNFGEGEGLFGLVEQRCSAAPHVEVCSAALDYLEQASGVLSSICAQVCLSEQQLKIIAARRNGQRFLKCALRFVEIFSHSQVDTGQKSISFYVTLRQFDRFLCIRSHRFVFFRRCICNSRCSVGVCTFENVGVIKIDDVVLGVGLDGFLQQ